MYNRIDRVLDKYHLERLNNVKPPKPPVLTSDE